METIQTPKESALTGFKKARSLIDTVIRMTEGNKPCTDILQQNLAVIGLLKSAHEKIMSGYLEKCFNHAAKSKSPTQKRQLAEEIQRVIRMYNK